MSAFVASRAERLVRALTGVADARVDTAPNGRITGVYVVPETGFSPHRVSQNVRSGLMAATGIVLEPARVYIVSTIPDHAAPPVSPEPIAPRIDDFGDFGVGPAARVPAPHEDLLAPAPDDDFEPRIQDFAAAVRTASPAPAPQLPTAAAAPNNIAPARPDPLAPIEPANAAPVHSARINGQSGDAHTQQAWPVFSHYGRMPRIELLEMQRDDTGAPRCRIIIESDGRRFLGTATNRKGSETTADLIAGAILHALEPLMPCDLHFDGMADVIIAGQRHVVVSLRNTSDWSHALSGAAPVADSVEHAIAHAIINAIGIGIAHTYSSFTRSVNHR